jgi:site-specific DNA-methyltransferase (adenine-specific)
MKTESASGSAIPLYHRFVQQAQKLNPRYLCMIIPSRWFSGGRGLDDFRELMLSCNSLVNLVDYTDSRDCFPGVDIAGGVCYFLWQKDYKGPCNVCNIYQGKRINSLRYLNEFPVFIRHSQAIDVIHKVISQDEITMNNIVYSSKPFGFRSFESGRQTKQSNDIELLGSKGITFVSRNEVQTNADLIYKWKVVMSKASAEHAGQTDQEGRKRIVSKVEVLGPGQICTETYLLLSTFNTEEEAINLKEYVKTRFFRFLLSTILLTQNIAKDKFQFVPFQDFSKPWTDEELYAKYGLTEEEIAFIESMIRPME